LYFNIISGILVIIFSFTLTASFGEASENLEDLIDNGITMAESGQYEEALSYFDKVLETESDNVRALNAKAITLGELEQYDEAFLYLDRILEQDPDNLLALNTKGVTLVKLEQYDEALSHFEKILDIVPANNEAQKNKLMTLGKLAELTQDISYLDKILDISPDNVEVLNFLGELHINLGQYQEATVYLDQATVLEPSNIETLNLKGQLLANLEQYEEAVTYFDQALLLEPQNLEIQSNWLKTFNRLPTDEIEGFVRIQLRDQNGKLIAYLEDKNIRMIRHSLSNEALNQFTLTGVITKEGQDFNVFEKRLISIPLSEKYLARVFIGSIVHERQIFVFYTTDLNGFFFQKDDKTIVDWVILKPV